jgi:CRISPR-associated protein Csb2
MALVMEIELITGRYEAAGAGDRDAAEWPPHPARVFCALVASARDLVEHEALRWLEALPAPVVQAAGDFAADVRSSYVVTNKVEKNGGSQFHPGRTNALRTRRAAIPASSSVRMVWPTAKPEPTVVATLDNLARRVPYIGRSSGVATLACRMTVDSDAGGRPDALTSFEPVPDGDAPGTQWLRVPYVGYLDDLVAQYEDGQPPWQASRTTAYRRVDAMPTRAPHTSVPEMVPSVYSDVIVLRFRGVRLDGSLAPLLTEALRKAVMAATADPLPDALHGHGELARGRPHVAFLALPDVGHPHADGHLLGMSVAIPDLPRDERRSIVRAVLDGLCVHRFDDDGRRVVELRVARLGSLELEYQPGLVRPWGVRPERWRQGSQRWVSVTPVVLDRFPRRDQVEAEVARSCQVVGLPEPSEVTVSNSPLVQGGIRLRPGELPEHLRGRLYRHVELGFPRQVSGPLLLGAGRYLGIGLFAPLVDSWERR